MRFSRMLTVVDAHAEGESGKVVVGGVGPVPGSSMFDNNAEADFGYIILESTEYPADQEGSSRTTGRHATARPTHTRNNEYFVYRPAAARTRSQRSGDGPVCERSNRLPRPA